MGWGGGGGWGDGCILCPSTAIHQGILESEVELASNRRKNGKAEQKREKIFPSWKEKKVAIHSDICLKDPSIWDIHEKIVVYICIYDHAKIYRERVM